MAQLRLTRPVEFLTLETMSRKNRSPAKAHPKKPALATEYFKFQEPGVWFIIGSGAMFGGPNGIRMHPKLHRILNALSAAGIKYDQKSSGSAGNCDSYTFSAAFDGGTLSVVTGNYWFGSRGGTIVGAKALERLIALLGLRVSARTARAWGMASPVIHPSNVE